MHIDMDVDVHVEIYGLIKEYMPYIILGIPT